MKIERIDPKTVKCFLTLDELKDYEITYKDFITRNEKSKEVLREIICQAEETVGFHTPDASMDLQIMMLPDQGMVLTFSENSNLEQRIDDLLANCFRELLMILEAQMRGLGKVQSYMQESNMTEQTDEALSSEEDPSQEHRQFVAPNRAGFIFESIRAVCDFAKTLPQGVQMTSSLYRHGKQLFLWMECAGEEVQYFREACFHAVEYATLYATDEAQQCYLNEHGEKILMNTALERLRRKTITT
ncbi:MAG: adaptor protein MecA [Clostridium sp.]|jgi:negative regulator of genetic competence, sporulation and motility|nr:adaptor protein MecA [Clostridium sp.]